jgi:hypothetical protein
MYRWRPVVPLLTCLDALTIFSQKIDQRQYRWCK